MLERVAADDSAETKNRTVGGFERFCEAIDEKGNDEICASRVSRRKQQNEQQDGEH